MCIEENLCLVCSRAYPADYTECPFCSFLQSLHAENPSTPPDEVHPESESTPWDESDDTSADFGEVPTLPVPYAISDGIPCLLDGVDLTTLQLTVFEAFVVSRIDGASSISQLRSALDVTDFELQVVIETLKHKGIILLRPVHSAMPPLRAKKSAPQTDEKPDEFSTAAPQMPVDNNVATPPPAPMQQPLPPPPTIKTVAPREPAKFETIESLFAAIQTSRNRAPLYNRLALMLLKQRRDVKQAEALLRKAIKEDPRNPTYQKNLTQVLFVAASLDTESAAPRPRSSR